MAMQLFHAQVHNFSSRSPPPQPRVSLSSQKPENALPSKLFRRIVISFRTLRVRYRGSDRSTMMSTFASPDISTKGDDGMTPSRHPMHNIFIGPDGMRAGWRLLIAVAIFIVIQLVSTAILVRIPMTRAWLRGLQNGLITPGALILSEVITVMALIISALVMARIEHRSFRDYGLPISETFGKRFWQGGPYGLAMLTLLMAIIAALHGFSVSGWALGGTGAFRYGALYFLGFILVAIFEEFSFRGYLQSTLASGIGFWPAAILLAVAFGALHLSNSGEAILGAAMAGAFGLLCAFSLRRIGTIWFAIGMHAAWDWGETYFYSVPDSGIVARGHLLNSSFQGPGWLTGGSVGPEGSVFVFGILVLAALGVHWMFPRREDPV
jgi:membrane protease YdiL (CAAX protease family)